MLFDFVIHQVKNNSFDFEIEINVLNINYIGQDVNENEFSCLVNGVISALGFDNVIFLSLKMKVIYSIWNENNYNWNDNYSWIEFPTLLCCNDSNF